MKKFIKFCILVSLLLLPSTNAASIDKAISDSGINRSAVAISVRDAQNGNVLYQLNEKHPMIPASTLKLITYSAAVDTLGEDFVFSTELYKNINNEVYLKLGADPFLSTHDLKKMMETAISKKVTAPKKFHIDDFILDSENWGEGWQWDDDLNPLMPKFDSYNLDKNLLTLIIEPTIQDAPAQIYLSSFYPMTFVNLVTTGTENDVELTRKNFISPDVITAEGSVKKRFTIDFPCNNPKRYFKIRLEEILRDEHLEYYGEFQQSRLPSQNIYLIDKTEHKLQLATDAILKQSNNFVAETLLKIAGGKFVNDIGSVANANKMLNTYFEKNNLNASDIRIVDGSGVSKNNLMTADFMSAFLAKVKDNTNLYDNLPTPSEGTLKNRMLYFKDNLKAKTGTVSNVSALAGYIKTQKGKLVAFDIMINDSKSSCSDKKMLEEYIIRAIYTNY